MIKNNKFTIGVSLLFILIGMTMLLNRDNYDEPTGGMDVGAGISEEEEHLNYWLETEFIPNAKYTVNITLYLPVGTDDSSLVIPLKETTFRADKGMVKFEDTISIQEIKDEILNVDDLNFDNLELTAENWRDYEYVVNMHRTKFWKTYDSVGLFTQFQAEEYTGEILNIKTIGEVPKIEAENIIFTKMTFNDFQENPSFADSDAVFVMPEHLEEASKDKYIELYKEMNIPIFFIGTTKSHIPFVFDDATYDDVADVSPVSYAAGYLYDHENELGETWVFPKESTDEEEITDKEIREIYTEIFTTIEYIKENYVKYFP